MTNSRFKFRVWNKLRKEWDNRWLLGADGEPFFITNDSAPESKTANKCYFTEDIEIVQSTGLYDCEGKEIWEGDIIEKDYCEEGEHRYREVVFKTDIGSCGCCYPEFKGSGFVLPHGKWKVAGNRFESPELLEGEE